MTASALEKPNTQPRCVVAHVIARTCTATKRQIHTTGQTTPSLPTTSVPSTIMSSNSTVPLTLPSTQSIAITNVQSLTPTCTQPHPTLTQSNLSPLTSVATQKFTRKRTQDALTSKLSLSESVSLASSSHALSTPRIPTATRLTAEASFLPPPPEDSSLERSNLNVDEFMLEAKAKQNLLLSLWKVHFNRTVFSSHMDELDFNTATLTNKLSTEMLCSLATRVVQQLGKEKGVRTIECLTLPCATLSFMQIASLKIASVLLSTLHIKQYVIPFTIGDIPNDRVLMFSIITVAENLTNCRPLCLKFVCTEQSISVLTYW